MPKDNGVDKAKKAKKGMVIDRARNRTIDQSIAHSAPKWDETDHIGVLRHSKWHHNLIRRGRGNKWESVSLKDVLTPVQHEAPTLSLDQVISPTHDYASARL